MATSITFLGQQTTTNKIKWENFRSTKCVRGLEFRLTSVPCYVIFQNSKVIFCSPGLCYTTATTLTEHAVTPEISKRELIMANKLKSNLSCTIKKKFKMAK